MNVTYLDCRLARFVCLQYPADESLISDARDLWTEDGMIVSGVQPPHQLFALTDVGIGCDTIVLIEGLGITELFHLPKYLDPSLRITSRIHMARRQRTLTLEPPKSLQRSLGLANVVLIRQIVPGRDLGRRPWVCRGPL